MAVTITGISEVLGKLDRLQGLTDPDALTKTGADLILTAAQDLAPRLTGALAADLQAAQIGGGTTVTAGSTGLPYVMAIHNGWPAHNIEPTHYLTDAAQAAEAAAVTEAEHQLTQLIRASGLA